MFQSIVFYISCDLNAINNECSDALKTVNRSIVFECGTLNVAVDRSNTHTARRKTVNIHRYYSYATLTVHCDYIGDHCIDHDKITTYTLTVIDKRF